MPFDQLIVDFAISLWHCI